MTPHTIAWTNIPRADQSDDFPPVHHGESRDVGAVRIETRARRPQHAHENEQVSYIISGALKFILEGRTSSVRGRVLHIRQRPQPRGDRGHARDRVFSPLRQDWWTIPKVLSEIGLRA